MYGGFETFAAELSTRLVKRGHDVTVYCRRALYQDEPQVWHGVRRIELPAVGHKYLETVTHALLSSVDALGRGFDAVLLCNAANSFVLPLLRSARLAVAVNVDGIERRRRKWNVAGKLVHLAGEALSSGSASAIVADAQVIADYYRTAFGLVPEVVAYGSQFPEEADSRILETLGIKARAYVLYVSRFEPENNALELVQAYGRVNTSFPLVMVGDAPYARDYVASVRRSSDRRVIFPGFVFGQDYRTLQRNALLYVQATEVGGTHPAMIEAMGSGGAVLANNTAENREAGGDTVEYFEVHGSDETLSHKLQRLLDDPPAIDVYRTKARARAFSLYDWERVTDQYERLFRRLVDPSVPAESVQTHPTK